ncbi:hypothetical protein [Jeongeupia sp. USM3]|uniref:hypothetical protein n=1 Tax=Jeongeupia sp. USM3 TaxID=1906741 RepID=UPI00089DF42A|nr:hypothetical protein [Jeongeupia sp. USM3]AOY02084.1 hypothetical protein BJP62_17530 [Jeongeupia sp. USM3]
MRLPILLTVLGLTACASVPHADEARLACASLVASKTRAEVRVESVYALSATTLAVTAYPKLAGSQAVQCRYDTGSGKASVN